MTEPRPQEPILSIVTITLNDREGLDATLRSVSAHIAPVSAIEQIVVDGVSDYDVRSVIEPHGTHVRLIQETDRGIYDAMNKGLALSSGAYVLFLNSGDTLAPETSWRDILTLLETGAYDLIYGDSLERQLDGTVVVKKARSHRRVALGMFTHHQAMLFRRALCVRAEITYRERFRISGDYDFVLRFCTVAEAFCHVPLPFCLFARGGTSYTQRWQGRREQFTIRRAHYKSLPFAAAVYGAQLVLRGIRRFTPHLYWSLRDKLR